MILQNNDFSLNSLVPFKSRLTRAVPWIRWSCIALAAQSIFVVLITSKIGASEDREDGEFPTEHLEYFEKEIRPLLIEHCYSCHSVKADSLQAGLYLDSRQGILKGGDSGAALIPGDSASLLLESVRYESYEMPPSGKLSDELIGKLERWVDLGAPWPNEDAPTIAADPNAFDLEKRAAEHWAWQPVTNPEKPNVSNIDWPLADLDYFILGDLEAVGLQPAGDADRLALLRRLYLDLIGLPPSPEEVSRFLQDDSEGAIIKVVDHLLQSPSFGERWGRHWLDLVRYAESRGHEFDNDTPNAYQYRDYVIRALNTDIPYDQFVREQIAGDLIDNPRLHPQEGFNESVLGTGFWFLGEWVHSPVDIRKDEADRFDNMIDVLSKSFLGVTVACARCHDHKFDAISTADYYSLSGFLQSSDYRQVRFESLHHNQNIAGKLADLDHQYQNKLLDELQSEESFPPGHRKSDDRMQGVVVDYANLERGTFLQDGVIFGNGPRNAGSFYIDADEQIRIATEAGAANDLFWNGLKSITLGEIRNSSRVDSLPKSGRTLRTPTFELLDGNVTCFVAGRGHVVACIDSHRLVFGPLHGETIREINEGDRHVKLDLSRYVGHRLHLEFVPAEDARLSVRMVTQGLTESDLQSLQRFLDSESETYQTFASATEPLLNGLVEKKRHIFADFESGDYGDWTVEGDAFGLSPQTKSTIAEYQGDVNHRGEYFVNSHNNRTTNAGAPSGDKLTGSLTSAEFLIDFEELEFLVGGGSHVGKTCVNLVIDGKAVLSVTGKNSNRMELNTWDVRAFVGKRASIQILDAHDGGWGNIGADEFAFIYVSQKPIRNPEVERLVSEWKRKRADLRSQVRFESRVAPAMLEGTGEDDYVLIRGNSSKPGKLEPRHFLTAISGDEPMEIGSGSGRLQLAEAINDPQNPLTFRVVVNRIWHHLMGRGIVPTVDDFGVLGQRPSNLPLLDHLASKFLEDGRSIKEMIRYIVLSRTYRISSFSSDQALAKDPNNLLWHHKPPKRLEGEAIRDSLLALSGKLDKTQFGPPVPIHLTGFMDGRGRPGVNGPIDGAGRRSIYIAVRRNFLSPFMLAFDTPVPFSTMGRRNVSNVPAQALILMNDPFVVSQAEGWAKKAINASDDSDARIRWMYASAFARHPTNDELELAKRFVEQQQALDDAGKPVLQTWTQLAHILINTKEFIFLR